MVKGFVLEIIWIKSNPSNIVINKDNKIIADLNYEEDSTCEVDMNVIMTADGKFVEVQGTAEGEPFEREKLNALLDCATSCLKIVFKKQNEIIGTAID